MRSSTAWRRHGNTAELESGQNSTRKEKTMSSPSRTLRGRPKAPLPTQYAPNSSNSLQKSKLREKEAIVKGSSPTYSGQPKASSTHSQAQRCCTSVDKHLVSQDGVREFLRSHKNFLEEFILEDVPQEILERILTRKTSRKNPVSVHLDKQDVIHSLTKSIRDGVPINSILLQLSKSIADGM